MFEEDYERERESPEIFIDGNYCVRCGECVEVCPQSGEREMPVFRGGRGERPAVENPGNCILCFSCAEMCRARAISLDGRRRGNVFATGVEVQSKTRGMF